MPNLTEYKAATLAQGVVLSLISNDLDADASREDKIPSVESIIAYIMAAIAASGPAIPTQTINIPGDMAESSSMAPNWANVSVINYTKYLPNANFSTSGMVEAFPYTIVERLASGGDTSTFTDALPTKGSVATTDVNGVNIHMVMKFGDIIFDFIDGIDAASVPPPEDVKEYIVLTQKSSTDFIETAHEWSGPERSYGRTPKKFVGNNFRIEAKYINDGNESSFIGLDTDNTLKDYAGSGFAALYPYCAFPYLGNLYKFSSLEDGAAFENVGTIANGEYWSLSGYLSGSNVLIKLQKSTNGTTWTDVYTFDTVVTGDLFPKVGVATAGKKLSECKLTNPVSA